MMPMHPNTRLPQIILIGTFLGFCWLAMQAVHELGHVLGAVASGGTVAKVVLYPTTISRTDVFPNPHPLIEVWAGAVLGSVLPLLAFLVARGFRCPGLYLFRFFAGFCLIANGVYLGGGAIQSLTSQGFADGGELLMHGASPWHLILFGLATVPVGLFLWNGQGTHFGLGEAQGHVSRSATVASLCLFVAIVAVELAVGSR
jgi:hypothetical protein